MTASAKIRVKLNGREREFALDASLLNVLEALGVGAGASHRGGN